MKGNMNMVIKNSTSTTTKKVIFLLEKYAYTYGPKRERAVSVYRYDPETSTFVYHDFYGRIRDVLRGIKRFCTKSNTDFRVVYLQS